MLVKFSVGLAFICEKHRFRFSIGLRNRVWHKIIVSQRPTIGSMFWSPDRRINWPWSAAKEHRAFSRHSSQHALQFLETLPRLTPATPPHAPPPHPTPQPLSSDDLARRDFFRRALTEGGKAQFPRPFPSLSLLLVRVSNGGGANYVGKINDFVIRT